MNITINTPVACRDGSAGHVSALIVNPLDNQLTHIVVREAGLLGDEHEIALSFVAQATREQVTLNCTLATLAEQPPFIVYEYIPAGGQIGMAPPDAALYWPYASIEGEESMPIGTENVPKGETVLHRGAAVHATDGRVGRVDELIFDEASKLTHLMMREGHLWGQKEITIPVGQIDHINEDGVYLKLAKHDVTALPAVPIARNY